MITARQAILYAETQGWGHVLEANIGQTTVDFLRRFQPGARAMLGRGAGRADGGFDLPDR